MRTTLIVQMLFTGQGISFEMQKMRAAPLPLPASKCSSLNTHTHPPRKAQPPGVFIWIYCSAVMKKCRLKQCHEACCASKHPGVPQHGCAGVQAAPEPPKRHLWVSCSWGTVSGCEWGKKTSQQQRKDFFCNK